MTRAIILIMDSLGIGASDDAPRYGDQGANTLGHIAEACEKGEADRKGLRQGPLRLPNLARWGMGKALESSSGYKATGLHCDEKKLEGAYGYAVEQSRGKDTPSGHWELAGVPVPFDWGVFPRTVPCFPQSLVDELVERCQLPGILGNCHASGTEIIEQYGQEHIDSGKPILYTSADSVLQIAAHEEHFGLERLYQLSSIAKELVDKLNITRVIARPFINAPSSAGNAAFQRTSNRRDLTTAPIAETLLDKLVAAGGTVVSVGKIADIFAHRGISKTVKGKDNMDLFDRLLEETESNGDQSLIFVNFVDFDAVFGHRRDIPGYAAALEAFDARLPELEALLKEDDLVLISADHGCDPSWPGSDHTREHVPVLFYGPNVKSADLGQRNSFADMGQTLAQHLQLAPLEQGKSCWE
ncbi:phosphopentomutase [Motiliproteus sp. MSK22-1]|uniref:phosphopentomutase n=1 Tax=Motiliproteus sp. MSK22-1 TaxID=1897630 RepID=UPI000977648A|nr:phosphopentomutase [Motiliproteus sp. MSK22-1]OMH32176.1 phosphopentomutase [Motiliproteus sp. MSK22-1]